VLSIGKALFDPEAEHQQGDRNRKDAVAEGDDPTELDLVPLPPLYRLLSRHPRTISHGRDGTETRSLLECPSAPA
jgi:hypothetical protein